MNLSANFTLKELTKSDTATRLGLDNTPDDEALENLKTLCEKVLQPVRDHFGKSVTVNSGYRSPESMLLLVALRLQTTARVWRLTSRLLVLPMLI
jgi:hypothetical protein